MLRRGSKLLQWECSCSFCGRLSYCYVILLFLMVKVLVLVDLKVTM
jgi:hypothetical protein